MEIKKYRLKSLLLFSLLALILPACNKNNNIDSTIVNMPVVESYLVAGDTLTVKIYSQKSLTDTAQFGSPITGLKVYVSDGTNNIQLTESAKGTYTYDNKSFLATGKTYTLQFNYLTFNVSAKTTMPAKPVNFASQHDTIAVPSSSGPNAVIDTLDKLSWDNPSSVNHVLVFKNLDGSSFPIGRGNRTSSFELSAATASIYDLTDRSFGYYGHYQVLLFSVNQEYINILTSNTQNSTSQNLINASTNIVNGYGIFTAMQAADTLKLTVYSQ
jgi:hypothetical protein